MTGTRTLIVTNDFWPKVGGIERLVLDLADRLNEDNGPGSVVVHAPRDDSNDPRAEGFPGTIVRDPRALLLPTPSLAKRLEHTFKVHSCEQVVFASSMPLGLLAPQLRRAGASNVWAMSHGHEVWWARLPVTRLALRHVADSLDELTYISGFCRDRIAPALSDSARSRFRPLSPRPDPAMFYPGCGGAGVRAQLGIEADVPVAICVGRLIPRKGQDTLIDVWGQVRQRHPGAVLLLVGEGPYRERLERRVRKAGLTHSIRFLGERTPVAAYYDAADVFAMPTRARRFGLEIEAFGLAYLEAAACGLPVVHSGSGGTAEAASTL